jgi:uncharacterized membrane protein
MDSTITNVINVVFALLIAVLSIVGYVLTNKRTGQRWSFWIVSATGWTLLSMPHIMLLVDKAMGVSVIAAIWLSSYILIVVSLVLLFLKLLEIMKLRGK